MRQQWSTLSLLKQWIILHGILWPVGYMLNWTLVYILIYGLGRTGLYSMCESMIQVPSPSSPLEIAAPCLQRWFAFVFFWAGIIVGRGIGFVQWRIALRQLDLPQRWIDINTISWAVGGPVVYLVYVSYLRQPSILLFPSQTLPEVMVFTWVFVVSELISCIGEQRVLAQHGYRHNYWFLSNFLGLISAGFVHVFLPQWLPAIWYIGLFVGVTSGFALRYYSSFTTKPKSTNIMPSAL